MKTIIQLLLLLAPAVVFPQLTFEPFSPAGCIWQTVGNQGFSAGTINYTSLAIQPVSEQPYVAYVDIPAGPGNVGPATVMRFDGSNWVNVGNAGFTTVDVGYPSLAFGPGGVPYLAYGATCTAPNQATVMKFVENSWFPVGIGGFSDGQTAFTSLAFSPAGQPYVAFMDMANSNKTTVMKFDGTNWVNVGIPGFSAGEAWYENIGFSASGDPYISYWNFSDGQRATVMKFNGTDWVFVGTRYCTEGCGEDPSLAVHPSDGQPYLAYSDTANAYKATVIRFDGSAWVNVGNTGFSTGQASAIKLAFSPSGQPIVFYWDNYLTNSVVKKFDGTNWVNTGNQGFTGGYITFTSLAVSPSGIPFVAYQDYMNSDKATVMKYDFPVGLNENQARGPVCYPNPATIVLHVNLSNIPCEKKVIEIHNMQGQMVSFFHTSADKFTLNTQDYPVGIYTLTIRTKNSNDITRFCKY
ncbi:MAG: T9SS type A sorting domain-containing protein [bacterium]